MIRNATISEYTINQKNYHSLLLSSFSFKNNEQFLIYFPLLFLSLKLNTYYIRTGSMIIFFLFNSISTGGITYFCEKKFGEICWNEDKILMPKFNGGVNALGFCFLFLNFAPKYTIFKIPFYYFPSAYLTYEVLNFFINIRQDVCYSAHFMSILNGLLFGYIFKKWIKIKP